MYKQLIIARKDLNMSPGKLAAQVSHASMAFLVSELRKNIELLGKYQSYLSKELKEDRPRLYRHPDLYNQAIEEYNKGNPIFYMRPVDPSKPYGKLEKCEQEYYMGSNIEFSEDLWNEWFNGSFTKIVCGARSKDRLLKAIEKAKELGWEEGVDYFPIYDACRTELDPEGSEGTLTCIGFRPMPEEDIDKIGKEYHLY